MVQQINKEEFLTSINEGFDFYSFLIPDLEKTDDSNCKPVLNPFYEDTKPSLSIYFYKKKTKWLFYDHGTSSDGIEYKGDVFDFAGHHYRLNPRTDFRLLIEKMATDLNVKLESDYVYSELPDPYAWFQAEYWRDPSDFVAWSVGFEPFYRGSDNGIQNAYSYYKQYGITEQVLREYRVAAIDWYKQADKALDIKKIRISKDQLLIAYQELDFVKFYCPDPKKFWFAGTKQKDYVFGWKQIIRRTDKAEKRRSTLLITGGEKDVLTLTSLGYDAVCVNSETASIPKEAMENLISRYEKIVILYDLDQTGVTQATKVAAKLNGFNVSICTLPDSLKDVGGKDVSDYIRLGMPVSDLQKLIEEAVMIPFKRDPKSVDANPDYLDEDNTQEGIDSSTPLLPDEVYSLLPQTLQRLCAAFDDKRDRDVALLSSITVLSSCFPHIRGIYGGKDIGCNLNLFISAPASAGKGIMSWSRMLGKAIANHLKEKYKQEFRQYQYDLAEYNKDRIIRI